MKQRILLIDDSQRFYRLLMDGFGSYFIIDWAKDFGECQRQLKANNYHLILLDIVFDEIDQQKKTVEPTGFKILDAIKVSHPLIPVIIVTGEGVKDSIAYSRAAKAVKRGASAILIKWEYDVGQWLEIFRTAINEGDENLNKLRTEIEQNRHTEAGVLAMTKLAKVF